MKAYDLGILAVQNDEFYPFGKQSFFFEDMMNAYQEESLEVLFFSPLDWNQGTSIQGFEFQNGKWSQVEGMIPNMIYDRAFSKDANEKRIIDLFRDYLTQQKKIILNPFELAHLLNDKIAFHEFLLKNNIPTLQTFQIAADRISEKDLQFTNKRIFLKPNFGSRGEGIFVIEKENSEYLLIDNLGNPESAHDLDDLNTLLSEKNLDLRRFFLQEEASTELFSDAPFDLRVLVQNYGDDYQITGMGVRIGRIKSVTANLNSGGRAVAIDELADFLKTNYNRELSEEIKTIKEICFTTSRLLDQQIGTFLEIGYDILITQEGPIIIEGNAKPSRWVFNVIADDLIRQNKSPEYYKQLRKETVRVPLVYASYKKKDVFSQKKDHP